MGYYNEFPHCDSEPLRLDWFLRKLKECEENIEQLQSRMAAAETKNAEQDGEINGILEVNTAQDGEIQSIKTVNTAQENHLDALDTETVRLNNGLVSTTTKANNALQIANINSSDITLLKSQTTTLLNDASALQEWRTETAQPDLNRLNGQVTGITAGLTQATQKNTQQDTEISALDARVTALEDAGKA